MKQGQSQPSPSLLIGIGVVGEEGIKFGAEKGSKMGFLGRRGCLSLFHFSGASPLYTPIISSQPRLPVQEKTG